MLVGVGLGGSSAGDKFGLLFAAPIHGRGWPFAVDHTDIIVFYICPVGWDRNEAKFEFVRLRTRHQFRFTDGYCFWGHQQVGHAMILL
jgi:hypothetical protein